MLIFILRCPFFKMNCHILMDKTSGVNIIVNPATQYNLEISLTANLSSHRSPDISPPGNVSRGNLFPYHQHTHRRNSGRSNTEIWMPPYWHSYQSLCSYCEEYSKAPLQEYPFLYKTDIRRTIASCRYLSLKYCKWAEAGLYTEYVLFLSWLHTFLRRQKFCYRSHP